MQVEIATEVCQRPDYLHYGWRRRRFIFRSAWVAEAGSFHCSVHPERLSTSFCCCRMYSTTGQHPVRRQASAQHCRRKPSFTLPRCLSSAASNRRWAGRQWFRICSECSDFFARTRIGGIEQSSWWWSISLRAEKQHGCYFKDHSNDLSRTVGHRPFDHELGPCWWAATRSCRSVT